MQENGETKELTKLIGARREYAGAPTNSTCHVQWGNKKYRKTTGWLASKLDTIWKIFAKMRENALLSLGKGMWRRWLVQNQSRLDPVRVILWIEFSGFIWSWEFLDLLKSYQLFKKLRYRRRTWVSQKVSRICCFKTLHC